MPWTWNMDKLPRFIREKKWTSTIDIMSMLPRSGKVQITSLSYHAMRSLSSWGILYLSCMKEERVAWITLKGEVAREGKDGVRRKKYETIWTFRNVLEVQSFGIGKKIWHDLFRYLAHSLEGINPVISMLIA